MVNDSSLFEEWKAEMAGMAGRITRVRGELRASLESKWAEKDWSFITSQIGMFSFTGLSPAQVRHDQGASLSGCITMRCIIIRYIIIRVHGHQGEHDHQSVPSSGCILIRVHHHQGVSSLAGEGRRRRREEQACFAVQRQS